MKQDSLELNCYTDEKGAFFITNRHLFNEWCRQHSGKQMVLKVARKRGKRSGQQNKFYWAVVVQEIRLGLLNIGYDMNKDEVHHWLKQKFNSVVIPGNDGLAIEVPKSTTELNKLEFGEYIDRIAQWAAEYLSIVIPAPNEDLKMQL